MAEMSTMKGFGVDPAGRNTGIVMLEADITSIKRTVSSFKILDWECRVLPKGKIPKMEAHHLAQKARSDYLATRAMWEKHSKEGELPFVSTEWGYLTGNFGARRSKGITNHIGYVHMLYQLYYMWTKGRVLPINARAHKMWTYKHLGVEMFGARPGKVAASKQQTKDWINELWMRHADGTDVTGLVHPVTADTRPPRLGWSTLVNDEQDRYEHVADAVSVGLFGLTKFEERMVPILKEPKFPGRIR